MTSTTISPSTMSSRRSTPCVEGCWGPILIIISSVRRVLPVEVFMEGVSNISVRDLHSLIEFRDLEILPEGVTVPVVGQEDAAEVGVSGEAYTKEVEGFALVPVRAWPDLPDRRHLRLFG